MQDQRGTVRAAVSLVAAGLLLGLATAAGPMFVSSVASALLADELTSAGGERSMLTVSTSGTPDAHEVRDADRQLSSALADHDLPDARTGIVVGLSTPDGTALNLIGRSAARSELPSTLTAADGEVAIDRRSAGWLGVDAGSDLTVSSGTGQVVEVAVGDLIEDFDRAEMPPAWRPVTGLLTVVDDPRIPPPPPAIVTSADAAIDILDRLTVDVEATDGPGASSQLTWSVTAPDELTFEAAGRLLPRLEDARRAIADPTTEVGRTVAGGSFGAPVIGGSEFDAAVVRVASAVDELAVPIQLLTMAAQLLALGGVAAAVVIGGRRRLARAQLWAVRGVSATSLGLRWMAVAAVPLAVGVVGGWGIADVVVRALGPAARLDPAARMEPALLLLAAGIVATLLVGALSGLAVRLRAQPTGRPRRLPPIAEVAAVTIAAVTVWQVDARGGIVTTTPDGGVELDPLAVALPITLVVAICAAGVRLIGVLVRLSARRPPRGPGWFLASRRLRSFGGATMGLTFLTATAAGLYVLSSTLHSSTEATIEEKIGLSMGADAVLPLSRSAVTEPPDPTSFPVPATRVRRVPEAQLGGEPVEVLAIDPETFAEVAYEPRHLADARVAELSSLLDVPGRGEARPAIVVGDTDGLIPEGPATVRVADLDLGIRAVAATASFPGASDGGPTVVVADGGALEPEDTASAARLAVDIYPELWLSRGDLDDAAFRERLATVEVAGGGTGPGATGPNHVEFTSELSGDPRVASAAWTFAFLRSQSGLVAVLALVGLLVHHVVRRRDEAFGAALTARMGLRRRSRYLAESAEVAGVTMLALVVGIGGGFVAARSVVDSYDPVPDIALPVVFHLPAEAFFVPATVAAVGVALTVVTSIRAVDRVPIGRALRSEA